jgi:hypothetical protein
VVVQGVRRIREPHPPSQHRQVLLLLREESGDSEQQSERNEGRTALHGHDIMGPAGSPAAEKPKNQTAPLSGAELVRDTSVYYPGFVRLTTCR